MTSPLLGNPTKGMLTWKTEWTISCYIKDCEASSTLICHTKQIASMSFLEMGWIQKRGDVWICSSIKDDTHKEIAASDFVMR